MKKSTTRSFWFVTIFLTAGVFTLWAHFFQAGPLMIENPNRVAIQTEQKFPAITPPKDVQTIKNTQAVVPQNTQNTQGTKPVTARTTKTS